MTDIIKYVGLDTEAASLFEEFRDRSSEPEYEIIARIARKARDGRVPWGGVGAVGK